MSRFTRDSIRTYDPYYDDEAESDGYIDSRLSSNRLVPGNSLGGCLNCGGTVTDDGLGDLVHIHGGRYTCDRDRLLARNKINKKGKQFPFVAALPPGRLPGGRR